MPPIPVDGLQFVFPDAWQASKYDEWAFYRRRWVTLRDGIKAVDLLACASDGTAWFIEVKDYRRHARTKILRRDHRTLP